MAASVLAAITMASLMTAPPASAHARLVTSSPASGAIVTGVTTARVVFNESVSGDARALQVMTASGRVLSRPARVSGSVATAPVAPLTSGRYALVYRVRSADGHTISNAIGFSVRLQDPPAATTTLRLSGERLTLSGSRVGTRTLRLSGDLRRAIGTVTCRLPGFPEPFQWELRQGRATGMLPFAGAYALTVTAYASASSTRTLSGVTRIRP